MTAFRATYADWRLIKTRGCVQIVFELPVEQADAAYQLLGGMPVAAREVWCGIARLDKTKAEPPRPVESQSVALPAGAEKERRAFSELKPAQQAGILCNERAFLKFMSEKFPDHLRTCGSTAAAVREICKVDSRAEITEHNADWSGLVLAYRLWQREPEIVPA